MKRVKSVIKIALLLICSWGFGVGNIDFIQRVSHPGRVELVNGIVTSKLEEPTRSRTNYYIIINRSRELCVTRPTYTNAQIGKPITIEVKHPRFEDQSIGMGILMMVCLIADIIAIGLILTVIFKWLFDNEDN